MIQKDLFEELQALLQQQQQIRPAAKAGRHEHLAVTGMVYITLRFVQSITG